MISFTPCICQCNSRFPEVVEGIDDGKRQRVLLDPWSNEARLSQDKQDQVDENWDVLGPSHLGGLNPKFNKFKQLNN